MGWQLPTIVSEVQDFEQAAAAAYTAYKAADNVDHGQHVHSAIEAVMAGVSTLVSSGVFGGGKVQVTVGGHANPGFSSVRNQTAPDNVTVHVEAVPAEPEVPQGQPGQPQAPAMSEPHQSIVPPPGPAGAAVTPASSYDPNAGRSQPDPVQDEQGETEA